MASMITQIQIGAHQNIQVYQQHCPNVKHSEKHVNRLYQRCSKQLMIHLATGRTYVHIFAIIDIFVMYNDHSVKHEPAVFE
jgi:hypothetical protein